MIRQGLAELVENGDLQRVAVRGWKQEGYCLGEPAVPRKVRASALLSPFDSLIWERARTERLFDFHYRLRSTPRRTSAGTATAAVPPRRTHPRPRRPARRTCPRPPGRARPARGNTRARRGGPARPGRKPAPPRHLAGAGGGRHHLPAPGTQRLRAVLAGWLAETRPSGRQPALPSGRPPAFGERCRITVATAMRQSARFSHEPRFHRQAARAPCPGAAPALCPTGRPRRRPVGLANAPDGYPTGTRRHSKAAHI